MRLVFGKRPMMFYQETDTFECRRVRILYPDGWSEFFYLGPNGWQWVGWNKPCWSTIWPTSQRDQFKRMKAYDRTWLGTPSKFLGYL